MSVSLLDVLSCGLAVVVILLVISLNTGTGMTNEEKLTNVDLTIYGDVYLVEKTIKWKGKEMEAEHKSVQNSLFQLYAKSDSLKMDTISKFFQSDIYFPEFDSIPINDVVYRELQRLEFLFHPTCKNFEIEYVLEPRNLMQIKAGLSNFSTKQGYNKMKVTPLTNQSMILQIIYKKGVRIIIKNEKTREKIMDFFLKNTK